jgi:UDP-N-acetylglucosamine--N-acetylmuramyl-(pentapeptide) pyrophosphoryl-undecaprenol N-acetylglucosamine transferase
MAVLSALPLIKPDEAVHFIHQTGSDDEQEVKSGYDRLGVSATVQSFFDDMAPNYQAADLIICRAGATTIAEITAVGKAALFIPFPYAADDHQALNAAALVNHGAAEMILEKDLGGKALGSKIDFYLMNPDSLNEMAAKARTFGRPDAAKNIVDDCYRLINL